MKQFKDQKELHEFITERLNNKFEGFEVEWKKLVREVGDQFVQSVRDLFQEQLQSFEEIFSFKFTIITDNNFVFGQIKNVVEKDLKFENTFIHKLLNSPIITVMAPYKFREELLEKIETELSSGQEKAKEYAHIVLEEITLKDPQWIDEWKIAQNLFGHIDEDDVPYLALAIYTGSHAIISYDKIFKRQSLSKVWDGKDLDKVITSYHSGFVSFCLIGTGGSIIEALGKIIALILKIISEFISGLIEIASNLMKGAFNTLGKIPKGVYIMAVVFGALALIFSEDLRERGKNGLVKFGQFAGKMVENLMEFLEKIILQCKELWDIFKPSGITTLEFIGYFALEFWRMMDDLEKANAARAKGY